MVRVEDAVIARLEHAGKKFELLVDPDLALDLKKGKSVLVSDLVAIDSVFKDAKKGETQSETELQKTFHTKHFEEIARKIVLDGHVQLTTEQKRHLLAERKKELVSFLAQNCLDSQTKTPHPPQRIENALNEIKFAPDLFKSTAQQAQDALKELRRVLPISMAHIKMALKVPPMHAARASSVLFRFDVSKQEWQRDGSLIAVIDLPAGICQTLLNELNHLTHGELESKTLN